ncbi:hypothetical protein D3C73_955270 [compost metagenome]
MRAPPIGAWAVSSTRPLSTPARSASIAPGCTPVWIGFAPVYRKSVIAWKLAWPEAGSSVATLPGSGGRLPPPPLVGVACTAPDFADSLPLSS